MFFTNSNYYTGPSLTEKMIEDVQRSIHYRLPSSYLALLKQRNGGTPAHRCFKTNVATSWAPDHIQISGICGIGGKWGIDSPTLGSEAMIREWGYPRIGIVICNTPSGGHDAVMLDYTKCGPDGDPRVVYVDEDRSIVVLCNTFQEFLERLVDCP